MSNELFPVFLKLQQLNLLIVGGGEVGWEKMEKMFHHTQSVKVKIVAPDIKQEIIHLAKQFPDKITIERKKYEPTDLEDMDIVIAATANEELNKEVWNDAKNKRLLVNVADTPSLCDFYLSSVVKKGDLKIAISSNGKSPTLTKRMRELLEDVLPDEIDALISNLNEVRDYLKGDFEDKVSKLNAITHKFKERKSN